MFFSSIWSVAIWAETIPVAERHEMFSSHRSSRRTQFSYLQGYGAAFPPSARGITNFDEKRKKSVTRYLKKVIHGTSVLCVFNFTNFLQIQTHAISTPWSCLPQWQICPLWVLPVTSASVGALDMEGASLHNRRLCKNTCRTTVSVM